MDSRLPHTTFFRSPGPAGHVGDGIRARDELPPGQTGIQHAIEPIRLVGIAIDRIRYLFGRIVAEVLGLAAHRPLPRHLPHHPFDHDAPSARLPWEDWKGVV